MDSIFFPSRALCRGSNRTEYSVSSFLKHLSVHFFFSSLSPQQQQRRQDIPKWLSCSISCQNLVPSVKFIQALPATQHMQSLCQKDFPDSNGSLCRAYAASGEGLHLVSFSAYLLLLPCWASKKLDAVWPSATSPSKHTTEASLAIKPITLCPHLFSLNHISLVQLFLPPFHLGSSYLVSPASVLEQQL